MKRPTIQRQLEDLTGALYRGLYDMTPRQRSAAYRTLERLTDTNCGWVLYRLRAPLRELIDAASHPREITARARARKAGQR